jgi:ABC-type nitrate/sulfonate/bicarbonate transport system substrate-binding protein
MDGTLWHGPNTQCVVVIVKTAFAASNPRVLKKMLHMHVAASRMMINDSAKSAEIISKMEGAPIEATKLALSHMHVTPVPSVASLIKWRDKMAEFGFTPRKAKMGDIVDLGPLRQVLVESGEKQWLVDLDNEIKALEEVKRREA